MSLLVDPNPILEDHLCKCLLAHHLLGSIKDHHIALLILRVTWDIHNKEVHHPQGISSQAIPVVCKAICRVFKVRLIQDIPVDHPVIPVDRRVTLADHLVILGDHRGILVDHPGIPVEHPVIRVDHLVILVEHQVIPVDHQFIPVDHPAIPVDHPAIPEDHPVIP